MNSKECRTPKYVCYIFPFVGFFDRANNIDLPKFRINLFDIMSEKVFHSIAICVDDAITSLSIAKIPHNIHSGRGRKLIE